MSQRRMQTVEDVKVTLAMRAKRSAKDETSTARHLLNIGNISPEAREYIWTNYVERIAEQFGEVLSKH